MAGFKVLLELAEAGARDANPVLEILILKKSDVEVVQLEVGDEAL